MRSSAELVHHLMDLVTARVEGLGITQTEAAERAGVAAPRISEIKHHRAEIGVDGLVSILARLGVTVAFEVHVVSKTKRVP